MSTPSVQLRQIAELLTDSLSREAISNIREKLLHIADDLETKNIQTNTKTYDIDHLLDEIDHKERCNNMKSQWIVGTECEIYSKSERQWLKGAIVKIFEDEEGEWFLVKYNTNTFKEIQRYSNHIRAPIHNDNENKRSSEPKTDHNNADKPPSQPQSDIEQNDDDKPPSEPILDADDDLDETKEDNILISDTNNEDKLSEATSSTSNEDKPLSQLIFEQLQDNSYGDKDDIDTSASEDETNDGRSPSNEAISHENNEDNVPSEVKSEDEKNDDKELYESIAVDKEDNLLNSETKTDETNEDTPLSDEDNDDKPPPQPIAKQNERKHKSEPTTNNDDEPLFLKKLKLKYKPASDTKPKSPSKVTTDTVDIAQSNENNDNEALTEASDKEIETKPVIVSVDATQSTENSEHKALNEAASNKEIETKSNELDTNDKRTRSINDNEALTEASDKEIETDSNELDINHTRTRSLNIIPNSDNTPTNNESNNNNSITIQITEDFNRDTMETILRQSRPWEFHRSKKTSKKMTQTTKKIAKKAKRSFKRIKRTANSWIKLGKDPNKHDPSVEARSARKASIIRLKEIANQSEQSKDEEKEAKSLIDAIMEDDVYLSTGQIQNQSLLHDMPITDITFSLKPQVRSPTLAINIIDQDGNKVEENKNTDDTSWIQYKKSWRTDAKSALEEEMNFVFDFRDSEDKELKEAEKNTLSIAQRFQRQIKSKHDADSETYEQRMRRKTFNAVKLNHETKEKAIDALTERVKKQKELLYAGYSAVPLLNDDDFVEDNDSEQRLNGQLLSRRKLLKNALKNEDDAMEHCLMIVEELGYLRYIEDDENYMQSMKSKENAKRLEHERKQHHQTTNTMFNMDVLLMETRTRGEAMNVHERSKSAKIGLDLSSFTAEEEKVREEQQDMAEQEAMNDIKNEENDDEFDLFSMNNSNLLMSLKRKNCHMLMRIISFAMMNIKSLRFMSLCNCGVDDYFMSQIVLQFMQNEDGFRMNTLDLQSNRIGDNGMLCLCELIRANNPYLKVIKLQNNRKDVSTGVCKQMCEALEENDYIIKFQFEFRHYGEKDRCHRAVKKNIDKARMARLSNKQ